MRIHADPDPQPWFVSGKIYVGIRPYHEHSYHLRCLGDFTSPTRAVDPHSFYADPDPDPAVFFNADTDPDPGPGPA